MHICIKFINVKFKYCFAEYRLIDLYKNELITQIQTETIRQRIHFVMSKTFGITVSLIAITVLLCFFLFTLFCFICFGKHVVKQRGPSSHAYIQCDCKCTYMQALSRYTFLTFNCCSALVTVKSIVSCIHFFLLYFILAIFVLLHFL